MEKETTESKYSYSKVSLNDSTIYLKSDIDGLEKITIKLSIALQGSRGGNKKEVNPNLSIEDYLYGSFINPYLTAQSDFFKLKYKTTKGDITIGFIFPNSSLEDDFESEEDGFDEAKQAYKFYTIRKIINGHKWNQNDEGNYIGISHFTNPHHSHLIIFKPLLKEINIDVIELLPSLALYGYYNFTSNETPNILKIGQIAKKNPEVAEVVENYFTLLREQESLSIKSSLAIMNKIPLVKLLYKQILIEADNPLYRFLVLYQIIEYLVDKSFRENLEILVQERDTLNGYDFITKMNEIKKTRTIINNLFESVAFTEKGNITSTLKSFLLEFNSSYSFSSTGDCLYDIRNLFFHDYKNVLEFQKTDDVISLVILCEILIHRLVIQYSSQLDYEIKNTLDHMPLAWLHYQALQE